MPGNILKKTLAVTCGDFLKEVYGERSKPEWTALTTLFPEVVAGRSTLVSDLSGPLRRDGSRADWKRAQERVSGWLSRYDFAAGAGEWLLGNIPEAGLDGLTFAVDFSDVSKVFGGKGMEGMAMGRDGSTGDIRMGHDFICVSLVGAAYREALPVYARLGRGRRGHGGMLDEAVAAVMARTGGRGWIVGDRGMDSARLVVSLKEAGLNAVVRARDMGRDVFGDGKAVDASMGEAEFVDVMLAARTGSRRAQVRWRRGTVRHCEDPGSKDAPTRDAGVLVVESRLGERSLYLYVVCPDWELSSPRRARLAAERAAQAYRDRWGIETSFYAMKQEFALEGARVRTFRRLGNIFALCVLAYVFATRFLRRSRGFRRILKILSDNLGAVSARTHALLAGIRALVGEARVRLVAGRPRRRPWEDSRQMLLAGF